MKGSMIKTVARKGAKTQRKINLFFFAPLRATFDGLKRKSTQPG
jgi:hypothetical protein